LRIEELGVVVQARKAKKRPISQRPG